jgi:hypothetical protein
MSRRSWIWLLALGAPLPSACSSFSDGGPPRVDAVDAAEAADASVVDALGEAAVESGPLDAGPRCNPSAPFGTPALVTGIPAAFGAFFTLTADESRAYYNNTDGTLFVADRIGPLAFGPGKVVSVLRGGALQSVSHPRLSEDRTILFFEAAFAVWRATGPSGGPYGNAAKVSNLALGDPEYDEARGQLYVSRVKADSGSDREIVRATVTGATVANLEIVVGDKGTSHNAVAGGDGKSLWFASQRPGSLFDDVYFASVPVDGGPEPARQVAVSSTGGDVPTWLSRDGCHLYITSNRQAGFGNDVFRAARGN